MCLEVILGLAKKLMIEYKQVFLILYMRFETPLKNRMGKKKGKFILVALRWTEGIAHYESYRKT